MQTSTLPTADKTLVRAEHLSKTYPGRNAVHAVYDVSLRLIGGTVVAFLGPNGAGKSTCVKMLAGLIQPDAGTVEIAGRDVQRSPGVRREIGVLLEGSRNLYWRMTPLENLIYFAGLRGVGASEARGRARALLERLRLADKQNALVQSLSRGMQQRVAIATALVHEPRVLLLDEPTLGLDLDSTEDIKGIIRALAAEGRAVLITTHQFDVAEALADQIAVINHGRLVADARIDEFIARFSGQVYVIEVAEDIPSPLAAQFAALGAVVEGRRVSLPGSFGDTLPLLSLLQEYRILRVERERVTLSGAYLRLLEGGDDAALA